MGFMNSQKVKAQSILLFSLMLMLVLYSLTSLSEKNANIKLISQMNYLIVVVGLLFLNVIIFLFMLMKYLANKNRFPILIISLAFLSSLTYFIETIVLIHNPINNNALIQTKSNDVSIFYLFRQLSFISLISLALYCSTNHQSLLINNKKKKYVFLIALIPFVIFPILAHNLSSYNPNYALYIADYCPNSNSATWGINYTKILIFMWAFLLFFIIAHTRLTVDIWSCIALICLSSLCCNLLLLMLDEYNYPIWYISRAIEILTQIFTVAFLIYSIFEELQMSKKLVTHDALTNIYNRSYFFDKLENLFNHSETCDFCLMLVDIDQFKRVNNHWGHVVGDKVLVSLTNIIQQSVRPEDTLARLEGKRFGLLFTDVKLNQVMIIAERIRKNVEFLTGNGNVYGIPEQMTISIGAIFSTTENNSMSVAMAGLDNALQCAKTRGGNEMIIHQI